MIRVLDMFVYILLRRIAKVKRKILTIKSLSNQLCVIMGEDDGGFCALVDEIGVRYYISRAMEYLQVEKLSILHMIVGMRQRIVFGSLKFLQ